MVCTFQTLALYSVGIGLNANAHNAPQANVLDVSRLWREVVTRMGAEEYPDVELSHMYVDNCAMQLIRNPRQFDVILTGATLAASRAKPEPSDSQPPRHCAHHLSR